MLDNLTNKQKKIIIIVGALIVTGIMIFIYNSNKIDTSDINEEMLISNNENNNMTDTQTEEKNIIIVHITGAVKNPGIVRLEEGSRIEDAINKAGGLNEDADITNVNLAYILEDGIKIKIPSNSDVTGVQNENILNSDSGENIVEEFKDSNKSSPLNINKATEQDLQNLPGIGLSLASKIIEYREENGKFSTIEDIKNVNGIGESKYENIKDHICVK